MTPPTSSAPSEEMVAKAREVAIKAKYLAENATAGPWEPTVNVAMSADLWLYTASAPVEHVKREHAVDDANFISGARELVPQMAEFITTLTEQVEQLTNENAALRAENELLKRGINANAEMVITLRRREKGLREALERIADATTRPENVVYLRICARVALGIGGGDGMDK